jgi:hypothetical protein
VATTRGPAPTAKRVSVTAGVRETIFFGSAASVTVPPSSSVSVSGNDGAEVGVGVGATVGIGVAVARAVEADGVIGAFEAALPEQAATTITRTARAARGPRIACGGRTGTSTDGNPPRA